MAMTQPDEGKTEAFMSWEVGGRAEKVVSREPGGDASQSSQPAQDWERALSLSVGCTLRSPTHEPEWQ